MQKKENSCENLLVLSLMSIAMQIPVEIKPKICSGYFYSLLKTKEDTIGNKIISLHLDVNESLPKNAL